jgi:predicted ATP-dependent endonuclease of OLD family
LGSGFQKIFIILLYALHPAYPVVLLDEPETHLHPGLIKRLLKVLSTKATNQIILTTHSPLFVQPQTLFNIFRVIRTTKEGTLVYNLDRSIKNIPRERLTQELNADNLEVFFADKVLIVEGVSDRLLMRGLIDKFYRGGLEIKVMEAHGKGNMDIYIGLLQRFHIPYVIMLDLDALDAWSQEYLAGQRARKNNREYLIKSLKEQGIYILPNGSIEKHYPRKYQRDDKKPVNALHAVAQITASEYTSAIMSPLREIIEAL